jgi:hypothetical protein
VDGSVLEEQASGPVRFSSVGDVPTLLRALEAGPAMDDAVFEHGLRLLIQGIEVDLQQVPHRGIE